MKPSTDPVLDKLLITTFIFALMLIVVEKMFPNDGQVFQVFSTLTAGFGGAVLMRVKPQSKEEEKGGKITEVEKTTTTLVSTPDVKPEPKS